MRTLRDRLKRRLRPSSHEVLLKNAYENAVKQKLLEAYRRTDLSWIESFVDELYAQPTDFEDILAKYKIEFTIGDEKPETFIRSAEYLPSTDVYSLEITENAFDDIEKGRNREYFKIELYEFLSHEDAHRQQNQLRNSQQPYSRLTPDAIDADIVRHLSQHDEIDASARGIAHEAFMKIPHTSNRDLMSKLINSDLSELLSEKSYSRLVRYRQIGGAVWRRLLKRAYEYLDSPGVSGGLEAYHNWLKNHQ